MYMILTAATKQQRMQVLVKLEQFVPQVQLSKLRKARMFNTATNFATMLIENQFDQFEIKDFTKLQFERGYFMQSRNNYKAAAKVFKEWSLPTEQLCLLFSEMFPRRISLYSNSACSQCERRASEG